MGEQVIASNCKNSGQKASKDIEKLNSTIKQPDLINISKIFLFQIAEYTFLSNPQGTFAKIGESLKL